MRCLHCRLDGLSASTDACPNCGVYIPALMRDLLPAGTMLHNDTYRVDYPLGRGGFGVTYRAMHVLMEQVCAIKEFYPQELAARNGKGGLTVPVLQKEKYERGLNRFIREGRTLKKLNHPNIVRVDNLFAERGTAYLVMDLIKGRTLRDEMEAQPHKRLTSDRAVKIMEQLTAALDAVHNENTYHLDLSPENVLIMPDGRAMLIDFGAARQGLGGRSRSQQYRPEYAPPEVLAERDDLGPESDIFELGMMLCEMLTGKLPPQAIYRLFKDDWKPDGLEEPWKSLLSAALKLKKEERPKSIKEWWKIDVKPSFSLQTYEFSTVRLNTKGSIIERRKGNASYYIEDLGGIGMEMVSIPGGSFLMGSPENEEGRSSSEDPQHRVTLQPFYMGKYPVTQAQWRAVAGLPKASRDLDPDPSNFKGDSLPVEQVSWDDAIEFCARLSNKRGRAYRLPSEAEWEYACRAGTSTPFAFGETITPEIVNYDGNYPYGSAPKGEYRTKTTPVGSLGAANGFGLYDMHGNVWEWQQDAWHGNYNGAPNDRGVWEADRDNTYWMLRGGSWNNLGDLCRSANRGRNYPDFGVDSNGFRVVVSGARTL